MKKNKQMKGVFVECRTTDTVLDLAARALTKAEGITVEHAYRWLSDRRRRLRFSADDTKVTQSEYPLLQWGMLGKVQMRAGMLDFWIDLGTEIASQ